MTAWDWDWDWDWDGDKPPLLLLLSHTRSFHSLQVMLLVFFACSSNLITFIFIFFCKLLSSELDALFKKNKIGSNYGVSYTCSPNICELLGSKSSSQIPIQERHT
jgi:hypothetical protein